MSADIALLLVYVLGALSISFLCSLLEATLLSARVSRLIGRADQGDRGAQVLLELKRHRIDDAISSILTLNTIAHTIGATLAGAQAAKIWGSAAVGIFSAVLTLLVLVVTEIIPKTLGTVHAQRLVGFAGRTIVLLTKVLAPAIAVTRALTRLIARHEPPPISRGELAALVATAAREGQIEGDESRLLENALRLERVRVEDVMTPRTVAVMLAADLTVRDFAQQTVTQSYSRFPVYEGTPDHVVGYVLQRELLRAAVRGESLETPIKNWVRDVPVLPEKAPLPAALRAFLDQHEHMAIVVDEFGGVAGLITLEDVIESILGVEIVDESDRFTDMRELASQRRDERLARRARERADRAGADARRTEAAETAGSEGDDTDAATS